jgi:hypothetical protein
MHSCCSERAYGGATTSRKHSNSRSVTWFRGTAVLSLEPTRSANRIPFRKNVGFPDASCVKARLGTAKRQLSTYDSVSHAIIDFLYSNRGPSGKSNQYRTFHVVSRLVAPGRPSRDSRLSPYYTWSALANQTSTEEWLRELSK